MLTTKITVNCEQHDLKQVAMDCKSETIITTTTTSCKTNNHSKCNNTSVTKITTTTTTQPMCYVVEIIFVKYN